MTTRLPPAAMVLVVMGMAVQACWIGGNAHNTSTITPATLEALSAVVIKQTHEDAKRKSMGCIGCHGTPEAPTMHRPQTVRLGCIDCHGGDATILLPAGTGTTSPAYHDAKRRAHVQPRFPDAWRGPNGNYSSANPPRSYTLLNREDPRFIRFVNPGDLRVARTVCGTCHQSEVARVESSLMTTSAAFWTTAAYNTGVVVPAAGARKVPYWGESCDSDGTPRSIRMHPPPSPQELERGVLPIISPLPRFQTVPPGDVFRVFEPGGRTIPSFFPDIGTAPVPLLQQPAPAAPGRPDIRQSMRGPGTGLRIAVPVFNLHKTRLNDPHLSFFGTNDHPGDFRSSGCSGCHVVYANDRDAVHSGPYAAFGNQGLTQQADPTIPKREMGHPITHVFTRAIPTSQWMVCHMHPPNGFLNSYLGFTLWDYETDGESMWPEVQRYPSSQETRRSLDKNPEAAAARGNWSDGEFLTRVSELNSQVSHTQFADDHGHGWVFRAVFKRDRQGRLLDDLGNVVTDVTAGNLQRAMAPRTEKEYVKGRLGIPVHLKDIHLEKGMHCVDCHFAQDAHGDGKLYGQLADAIEISCVDCHGTIDHAAPLRTSGPAAPVGGSNLRSGRTSWNEPRFEWRDGTLFQRSMVERGKSWEVVQVRDTIDPQSEWARANPKRAERSRFAKTIQRDALTWGEVPPNHENLAHTDERMTCSSCHTSWTPSCAGCHLPIQANVKTADLHSEAEETKGWASYNPQVVRDDMFMLGVHGTVGRGGKENVLIAPIRSSSAVMVSSENSDRERVYIQQPTISSAGFSGQAFNPHFPHTVRANETKRCTDCHVSNENDNNAWMAQLLGQGTNFVNLLGRYVYVGEGKDGFEAVAVTEWDEPQAVIGSDLQSLAYPDRFAEHTNNRAVIPRSRSGIQVAKHHGGTAIASVQLRGEYLYAADGPGGFRVYDVANIDNKGFSEHIVTAPVSPLGQRTYVNTRFATGVALPTTMPVAPSRQETSAFQKQKMHNQEQAMHPLYRYAYVSDRYEGLVIIDVETLVDGDPTNNVLERAVTFNPDGILDGATHITIAGNFAYLSCSRGIVIVNIDDPLAPRVVAELGAPAIVSARTVAVQFRYAVLVDAEGLTVVDVTFPERPRAISSASIPLDGANDIYVARGFGYIASGATGLVIVDVARPERPNIDRIFTAEGRLNDARAVKVGSTNAGLFAYVADGKNGLRVIQLTSSPTQPHYDGFNPTPVPRLIATYRTKGSALALSKGLDRDRAVDESGNQVAVFGRLGARPFTLNEQQRLYIRDGSVYTVGDNPHDLRDTSNPVH